jgi:hypothetical protein
MFNVINGFGNRRDPKIISKAHLGRGGLFVITGNFSLGDLLPKVDDEKVRKFC